MILLRNLSFGRGSRVLASRASLQLHPGWKIGLTGANGSGKSSFFSLLRGELHAEAGDLEIPAIWAIAHVAQDTPALPDQAIEFVLDGDVELRQIERAIENAGDDGDLIGSLYMRYGEIVSPKYTSGWRGKRSMSARTTVSPPSPESNTPTGRATSLMPVPYAGP